MTQTILVVEDDVEINELLGEYLSLEGFTYLSALDGRSGVAQAAAALPDAIILDLMLPDIDGYEVCRQLKARRPTATIPVIMLTCMNQDLNRHKGLAAGAFFYMNKPFLPDDLIAKLKDAFNWKNNLALRPTTGQIELTSSDPTPALQAINDMIADLFARTPLPDHAIVQIREGFQHLCEWASQWAQQSQRSPNLQIAYRLTSPAPACPCPTPALTTVPASASAAAASTSVAVPAAPPADPQPSRPAHIEWTLTEPQPGLLADMLIKPPAAAPTLAAKPLTLNGTSDSTLEMHPLTSWYQFLAKTGVTRFEKNTRTAQVILTRPLQPEPLTDSPPIPIVTIDGNRVPTRLRSEAASKKSKCAQDQP